MNETITNITLYKDFNFKEEWSNVLGSYDIEIIGEKARVKQNISIPFYSVKKSRLNTLRQIGKISGGVKLYRLIVNGLDVYFKK